ncbi:hypothetical protein PGT21_015002 [Puccinia graminis f. sp. tritici]|uniref:Uncharacterized protein n=1 Tax=Puccinia graminis f. sp. tritici TaxID=56615 RepID=A0A5B0N469_PUCGR|nr:hypothetical protein PGT21_015002 [Puccinia graminis f. sp. tritici]KAA1093270.1 hypothetical protein PGTUg99_007002 [Puccinia graminis f. sp. tritici]
MSTQITRRRSGSHFAQLIIIACILCASSINATPLPIASPSLGLSSQNSYLQPVSHLAKRMEIAGVAGAIATGQAVHNVATAREGAAALAVSNTANDLGKATATVDAMGPAKLQRTTSSPGDLELFKSDIHRNDIEFQDAHSEFPGHKKTLSLDNSLTQKPKTLESQGSAFEYAVKKNEDLVKPPKQLSTGHDTLDPNGASTSHSTQQKPNEVFSPPTETTPNPAPPQPELNKGDVQNPHALGQPEISTAKALEKTPKHVGVPLNPEAATVKPSTLELSRQLWKDTYQPRFQKFISLFVRKQTSKLNGIEVAKLEVPRETPKSLTPGSAPRPPSTEQVPKPSTETPNDLSAAPSNDLSTETPKPVNLADPKAVSPEAEKAAPRTWKQYFSDKHKEFKSQIVAAKQATETASTASRAAPETLESVEQTKSPIRKIWEKFFSQKAPNKEQTKASRFAAFKRYFTGDYWKKLAFWRKPANLRKPAAPTDAQVAPEAAQHAA